MLGRLISNLLKRNPTPEASSTPLVGGPAEPAAGPAAAVAPVDDLAATVKQLCAEGELAEAEEELSSRLPVPTSHQEAFELLRSVGMPLLTACAARGDASLACKLESIFYERLIKSFEEPSHYERCYGLMDPPLHLLGTKSARAAHRGNPGMSDKPRRLLFFVHNLHWELAHLVLLCDLIEAYLSVHPEEARNIGLVGFTRGLVAPRVRALQEVSKVCVMEIRSASSNVDLYLQVAGVLDREGFDLLVLTAALPGLSFLTGVLPAARIGWLSMKFELSCFEHLYHRFSFTSGVRRSREINGKTWQEAPPFFVELAPLSTSGSPSPVLQSARRHGTVFYTINREEKIRNPIFLQAVVTILEQVPNSCFVWTGRNRLAVIDAFFESRGMAERHFFAGWVAPDDLLHIGDIFLDTPLLSGTVAARAAACGLPLVTWTHAHSWINFFCEALARDRREHPNTTFHLTLDRLEKAALRLECDTAVDYIEQAVLLAENSSLRGEFAQALQSFAQQYFFNAVASAEDHFANFRMSVAPADYDAEAQRRLQARSSRSRTIKIDWVVDDFSGNRLEGWRSSHASVRYRALLPARELARRGCDVDVVLQSTWRAGASGSADRRPDVVVIGKLFVRENQSRLERVAQGLLMQISIARQAGAFVVADFVDDHFDRSDVGGYWRTLATGVDACVVSTQHMASVVAQYTELPVFVVPDPLASPGQEPRVFQGRHDNRSAAGSTLPAKLPRLVWYGHLSNWKALLPWLSLLGDAAPRQPFLLSLVTTDRPEIRQAVETFNSRYAPHAKAEIVPWSEEAQWEAVREADVVLVPSDLMDPKKAVKSSNRLTDALHAGRYVIASPLPAYLRFDGYVSLTDNPVAALQWYLEHPAEALEKISQGKRAAEAIYRLDVIADEWLKAFGPLPLPSGEETRVAMYEEDRLPETGKEAQRPAGTLTRLNLGCGDKILPGYINVDVAEARLGMAPDVLCDLRALTPFQSDYADEILSVHVVEHFWRWEIEEVLKEWIRVLKPGGKLILECPNLQAACEAFLDDPDARSAPGPDGQTTMWVFYGDPRWKDPLMVHRWGYTPKSLGKLLMSIGLVDVRQEPAKFKLREPRDMRVVGYKPLQ